MDKQENNKAFWKNLGMLAKALLRLFFVIASVITGYVGLALVKVSEWTGIIQEKLAP